MAAKMNSQNAAQIYQASLESATREIKKWPSGKFENASKTMSTKSLADFYQDRPEEKVGK